MKIILLIIIGMLLPLCIYSNTYDCDSNKCLLAESDSSEVAVNDTSAFVMKTMETASYKDNKYWKRHNGFKIAGWSCLGLGLSSTAVGLFVGLLSTLGEIDSEHSNSDSSDKMRHASYIILGIGVGVALVSIPMFALSKSNKKKAKKMSVSFNANPMSLTMPNGMMRYQQAIGVNIGI